MASRISTLLPGRLRLLGSAAVSVFAMHEDCARSPAARPAASAAGRAAGDLAQASCMANTETAAEPSMRKRPGKSVLIRLAIYVPLLAFFGWQAADRALDEREAADQAF